MGDDDPAALRAVVERAEAETRELGHGYIGSEHVLLALFDAHTRAGQRLENAGARYDEVLELIVRIVGIGAVIDDQQTLPYTPHAAAVLRRVRDDAGRAAPEAIGSEHVLRATLRRRGSIALAVLDDCGIDARGLADQLRIALPDDRAEEGHGETPDDRR